MGDSTKQNGIYSPSCVEKISLDNDKGDGIVVGRRQSKKTMRRTLYFLSRGFKRQRMDRIWSWRSTQRQQNSENSICLGGCVVYTNKNFWSVSLTDRPCGILRYPSHIFFSLSLIVKERGHHELSIVLTANFLAATGDFPCRGKTHCA